jgi:glycosyltransferase involved in cell wall biosynthesis
MEREPRISVVMSVYNAAKYLREAVDSILNQTFSDFEFIIIEDKSTDDSLNILLSYNDPRIVLILNNENVGLTKNLNIGIKKARGEFIARMDADDISLSNRFEEQIQFIKDNRCNICFSQVIYYGKEKKEVLSQFSTKLDLVSAELLFRNPVAHSTAMWRKDFFVLNNLFYDEAYIYSQDYELWTRVEEKCNIYVIDKSLLMYRFHNNQIGSSKSAEQTSFFNKANNDFITRKYKNIDISESINVIFNCKLTRDNYDIFISRINSILNLHDEKLNLLLYYFLPRMIVMNGLNYYNLRIYFSLRNLMNNSFYKLSYRQRLSFFLKCILNFSN